MMRVPVRGSDKGHGLGIWAVGEKDEDKERGVASGWRKMEERKERIREKECERGDKEKDSRVRRRRSEPERKLFFWRESRSEEEEGGDVGRRGRRRERTSLVRGQKRGQTSPNKMDDPVGIRDRWKN